MRTGSTLLNNELVDEVGTYARLWTISPVNGTPIRFTDCDSAIVFNGDTYGNEVGFTASSIVSATTSLTQGATISTTIGTEITADRIGAGYFDKAPCSLLIVDYDHPDKGSIKLFGGTVGEIKFDDLGKVEINVVGIFSNTVYINIETYGIYCRAQLGDSRCLFNIESKRKDFVITAVVTPQIFRTDILNDDDNTYAYGPLKFTSGFNNGIVLTAAGSQAADKSVTLFVPAPFVMTVGDTGTIYPGCDKTITQCFYRFNNVIHFRGEPFSPQIQSGL